MTPSEPSKRNQSRAERSRLFKEKKLKDPELTDLQIEQLVRQFVEADRAKKEREAGIKAEEEAKELARGMEVAVVRTQQQTAAMQQEAAAMQQEAATMQQELLQVISSSTMSSSFGAKRATTSAHALRSWCEILAKYDGKSGRKRIRCSPLRCPEKPRPS